MMPTCERCGEEYDTVYDYETWKYQESRSYHLCPECFQEDVDFLTGIVFQGTKLKPIMGYGKLNPNCR